MMVENPCSRTSKMCCGRIVAVHGSVVDVRFPVGGLSGIGVAITIECDFSRSLVAEVQLHLDVTTAREITAEILELVAATMALGGK